MLHKNKNTIAIVGGGLAGVNSALYLTQKHNINVDLYIKSSLSENSSFLAQGGIACVLDKKDTLQSHIDDTLFAGRDLGSKEAIHMLVSNAKNAIEQLIAWHVVFDSNTTGNFILAKEGGHNAHRILHSGGDASGKMILQPLLQLAIQDSRINFFLDTLVYSLHTEQGKIRGLYYQQNNQTKEKEYEQIILATGGAGQLYPHTSNPKASRGEGAILAYLAGASLCNLEFFQFHPTCMNILGHQSFLISETVRGAGAILRNSNNEAFMERYDKHQKDLAPRDVVSRAIHNEEKSNQSVFLDISPIGEKKFISMFPTISNYMRQHNIDINQSIPVTPGAHYMVGGVLCDLYGRTNVNGLYVCGEVAYNGIHGANRLASNSLLEAIVFGKQTADACFQDTKETPSIWQKSTNIATVKNLSSHSSFDDSQVQKLMWENVGIVRNETDLLKVPQKLTPCLSDGVPSVEGFQTNALALLAKLISEMAYDRKESIGTHFREDSQPTNNKLEWNQIQLSS